MHFVSGKNAVKYIDWLKMEDFAVDLDKVLDDFEESEGRSNFYVLKCRLYSCFTFYRA